MFYCLRALKLFGISLPAVGFAPFDDYQYLDFINLPNTSVSQPLADIGSAAVRMLDAVIKRF